MTQRGHLICCELKKNGIEYIVWVPDSETHFMHGSKLNDPLLRVIQVCAEGEAVRDLCWTAHGRETRGGADREPGRFRFRECIEMGSRPSFPPVLLIGEYLGYPKSEKRLCGKDQDRR